MYYRQLLIYNVVMRPFSFYDQKELRANNGWGQGRAGFLISFLNKTSLSHYHQHSL